MFIFLFRVVHRNSFLPFWIGRKNFSPAFHDRTSWKKSETMLFSLDSKLVIKWYNTGCLMGSRAVPASYFERMSCILIKLGCFYYLSPYVITCFILVLPSFYMCSLRFLQPVLWSRSFKATCKVVNRDCSKGYRTDFHSNHIKFFFWGGSENSLHYQIIFFSNVPAKWSAT